ncbi:hypothetical protein VPH35_093615 [Triticum aestivum]|uniref:uncharacterized protein n=1 Tax=Triticum aestivum TaxID=4565 RepID=UPI001D00A1E4|nr:uncharacterized protein LOC123113942 [Triticum aestivum]XP_044445557.1 uncharacterized protein LOC123172676 [Triticum aestivum]
MTAQALAPPPPEPRQLSLADLRAVSVLGRGAKGVVFHVVPEGEGGAGDVAMALKAVSQEAVRHKKSGGSGGGDGQQRRRPQLPPPPPDRDVLRLRHTGRDQDPGGLALHRA